MKVNRSIERIGFPLKKKKKEYSSKNIVDYAFDISVFANILSQAESLLPHLEQAVRGIGFYVSSDMLMCSIQDGAIFTLNRKPQKSVDYFIYLGINISSVNISSD